MMNFYGLRGRNYRKSNLNMSILIFFLCLLPTLAWAHKKFLPPGFVYLSDIVPTITSEIRYAGRSNIIGKPVHGYKRPVCIITKRAALALLEVQSDLKEQGLALKVFDCYRPQKAVNHFIAWSKTKEGPYIKRTYHPHLNKAELFKQNYIDKQSGHTRGSTVDLTVVNLKTHRPLDMGTSFDFMDERSNPLSDAVTESQFENRMLLRRVMINGGFIPFPTEWWHFTLKGEPFPNTYFDFDVE
jgi:zinc D-Ala-D-Ala dipeptidase